MAVQQPDLTLPIVFNYEEKYLYYYPRYQVSFPYYKYSTSKGGPFGPIVIPPFSNAEYSASVLFDGDDEPISFTRHWDTLSYNVKPSKQWFTYESDSIHTNVSFFNPYRNSVKFTTSNCDVRIAFSTKAQFRINFTSTGFVDRYNPTFKAASEFINCFGQYGWDSAVIYIYDEDNELLGEYDAVLSGTWSDMTVQVDPSYELILEEGNYKAKIKAIASDPEHSEAYTLEEFFSTTDEIPVANCVSPSGSFVEREVTFIWSHNTAYGTPQYAYDLQVSIDNGSTWTAIKTHEITNVTNTTATIEEAGVYTWRVRTYNNNDVHGEWAEATFVNSVPATPPSNLSVNTKGRPTVSWTSASQKAYQVQVVKSNGELVYDSGAIFTTAQTHFINRYFDDATSYVVRLRVYNVLGDVSEWVTAGYQQPFVPDISLTVTDKNDGGVHIDVVSSNNDNFIKYYLLRNNKLISEINIDEGYDDLFAIGDTTYSVVAVTYDEQSDIKTVNHTVKYDKASITTLSGQIYPINRRMNETYSVSTDAEADINKVNFFGDAKPSHFASGMILKSFNLSFYDISAAESWLGQIVFYADNFGNGDFCIVTNYAKEDSYVKDDIGHFGNETTLTLEVTNYDDSIEYPV